MKEYQPCFRIAALVAGTMICSMFAGADVIWGGGNFQGLGFDASTDGINSTGFQRNNVNAFSQTPINISQTYGPTSDTTITSTAGSGMIFSDVDGTAGTKHAETNAVVDGITFNFAGIDFNADEASSDVTFSGKKGVWSATETTSLINPHLSVNGISVDIPTNPGFNDVIYDQNGLTITLNSQDLHNLGQDGWVAGQAIRFSFNDYASGGKVYQWGGASFASSVASLQTVPEPASMAGFATLAGGLILCRRRKVKN